MSSISKQAQKMKFFFATAILVLAANAAASSDAVVSTGKTIAVEVEGRILQMQPLQVTVRGTARAAPRTVTYYGFDEWVTFGEAYSLCTSLGLKMASPKTAEDQTALAAVLARHFWGTWLGATCSSNGRWTWLSDRTVVTYNNFQGQPTFVPGCAGLAKPHGIVIYADHPNTPADQWFTWNLQETVYLDQVLCQV